MTLTEQAQTFQKIKDKLSDRWWRLNNLYYITNKEGKKVLFKPNASQKDYYDNRHYVNCVLKARQHGFTTFIDIYGLDACLFNSNHKMGIIAHTLDDAKKIFREKIKFAYDNLPDWLKEERKAKSDSARMLEFSNGSSIYVGTSLRSGTLQKLHVSEYGKISAKYPDKAKEIKTGALNTIAAGQQIDIESTAEGKLGEFYELCERARKLADSGKELARIEPKFHFYPWYVNSDYAANEAETTAKTIPDDLVKYFEGLEENGIILTPQQKAWYALKADEQGDDMTQEYPTTPEEAFQGSLEGAYYTKSMQHVRKNGQICYLPYDERHGVMTWWDLGLNDLMTVWFYQNVKGKHCFIDYHESSDEGWDYYAMMLKDRGYNYISHNFPHDGNKRVRGAQVFTDKQLAMQSGIRPINITPVTSNTHDDVVKICAPVLKNCWFDESKCGKGIIHLDNYRRKWSKADSMFLKEAVHDEASHGSDAFRTFAVNADKVNEMLGSALVKKPYVRPSGGSWMS